MDYTIFNIVLFVISLIGLIGAIALVVHHTRRPDAPSIEQPLMLSLVLLTAPLPVLAYPFGWPISLAMLALAVLTAYGALRPSHRRS